MSILFEDIFDVKQLDPDGKKFDRGAFRARRHAPRAPSVPAGHRR